MIDLDAPIIPGKSAGGITVGSRIEDVLYEASDLFRPEPVVHPWLSEPEPWIIYRSSAIDLWVKNGIVDQICVHDGYRGKLLEVVGLGATVADIESRVGPWAEDDEDNLIVVGVPGLCFEVEGTFSSPHATDAEVRRAAVTWFCVFAAEQ